MPKVSLNKASEEQLTNTLKVLESLINPYNLSMRDLNKRTKISKIVLMKLPASLIFLLPKELAKLKNSIPINLGYLFEDRVKRASTQTIKANRQRGDRLNTF
jgi:hypothetical protein